jgi:probable rRNA maturation factor
MILLDPDLDSHPATETSNAASSPESRQADRNARLPSARTLNAFLREAQTAIRLKGLVSVLLTTDKGIRTLNRDFRGKNKATDVLSFPAAEISRGEVAGDLAISVATARHQAREHGHSLATEIKILMLHGLLHLAGQDHETDNGEMAKRERTLRAKLALPLGLIERTANTSNPTDRHLAPTSRRKPDVQLQHGVLPPKPFTSALSSRREGNSKGRRPAPASQREATRIAPDGVRGGTRRTQSGESAPISPKPRRGGRETPPPAARKARRAVGRTAGAP